MVENFVSNDSDHLKGLPGGNRIHNDIAMNSDEVFRIHDTVVILIGSCTALERKISAASRVEESSAGS